VVELTESWYSHMAVKILNIKGQTFGRLKVIKQSGIDRKSRQATWQCLCTCGNIVTILGANFRKGRHKSCGCWRPFLIAASRTTHGQSHRTREYETWSAMQDRCYNLNHPAYIRYGGRGIKVCARWRGPKGFVAFFMDMGEKPEGKYSSGRALYSLDRWPDNDGNYTPKNCRWATSEQQGNNRSTTKRKV
jgi:hypothetical protein